MADKMCAQRIQESGGWGRSHACKSKATVGNYCKRHDPIARSERYDARHEAWKAKWAAEKTALALEGEDESVGEYLRLNHTCRYNSILIEIKEANKRDTKS